MSASTAGTGPSFTPEDLIGFFGGPTVRRAGEYVGTGLIGDLEWDDEKRLVTGVVGGVTTVVGGLGGGLTGLLGGH